MREGAAPKEPLPFTYLTDLPPEGRRLWSLGSRR